MITNVLGGKETRFVNVISSPGNSPIKLNTCNQNVLLTTEDNNNDITINDNLISLQTLDAQTDLDKPIELTSKNSFTVPAIFFCKYWSEGANYLSKGWTCDFNTYFENINNKCVLRFTYHKLKYGNKRKTKFTPFIAAAECKMQNCCQYKFRINEPLSKDRDFTINVLSIGAYNHDGNQTERRRVKGELRNTHSAELAYEHPSILAGKLLSMNDRTVLESGNRNHAPSSMILQKISSESKKKDDLDSNFHTFLCKLRNKYLTDEHLQGIHISGYVQGYSVHPTFNVTLFTEKQILEL